jgi:hypothetical protein
MPAPNKSNQEEHYFHPLRRMVPRCLLVAFFANILLILCAPLPFSQDQNPLANDPKASKLSEFQLPCLARAPLCAPHSRKQVAGD